jgi:hypothetical protein
MATTAYRTLPFPLCNLPEPDEPVTLVDFRDTALPLLRSARYTLYAASVTTAHEPWLSEDLALTLERLAGDVAECRDLIDRAPHDELRAKAVLVLGSAHVSLRGFSLLVACNQVLPEDLAAALDALAGQIEVCRDLVDRATSDR